MPLKARLTSSMGEDMWNSYGELISFHGTPERVTAKFAFYRDEHAKAAGHRPMFKEVSFDYDLNGPSIVKQAEHSLKKMDQFKDAVDA